MLILDFDEDVLLPIPPLEDDEEVDLNPQKRKTTETGLKILAPNKLLTRLSILLAQLKAGNNSYKLKNKIT